METINSCFYRLTYLATVCEKHEMVFKIKMIFKKNVCKGKFIKSKLVHRTKMFGNNFNLVIVEQNWKESKLKFQNYSTIML